MSNGKKSPLLPIVAVAVLAAGGAGAYFFMNSSDQAAPDSPVVEQTDTAPATESAKVETAAGGKETTKQPEVEAAIAPTGNFTVEPGNPVVAKVDGKEITRVDVYRFIQTMPANVQQLPASTVYPMALEQVINTRLVQNKADASDITSSEAFKTEVEMAKQQIARNLYLQDAVADKINEGAVKKSYSEYIKKIPDVEERRARHILVETEEKAKAVVAKLKTGEKFEELAKSVSVGPTAPKGGDLGYFAKKDMVPEFANAAFGMKKGSTLETPVKTQFGWHVIQLVDVRQRPKPTMDQLKPALEAEIRRSELDKQLKNWRKKSNVEKFDINGQPLKEGANAIGVIPEEQPKK